MIDSISSPDLLAALEANMVAFWSPYGRAPGCRLSAARGVTWFYTGIPHPLFNGVLSIAASSAEADATFAQLNESIAAGGAPALWWVGPLSQPADLGDALAARGLQPAGEVPGMALDLDAAGHDSAAPAGVTVETVATAAARSAWARTAAIGTGASQAAADALARIEAIIDDAAYRAQRRYLAVVAGVPVATATLVLDSGVAGIYAVATLPEHRNKGIGGYLTARALADARRAGYRVAILQSSSMGHPVYAKLGFRDVGTYRLYLQG